MPPIIPPGPNIASAAVIAAAPVSPVAAIATNSAIAFYPNPEPEAIGFNFTGRLLINILLAVICRLKAPRIGGLGAGNQESKPPELGV
ncbi:MAG: hypothetical protein ACP5D7_14180 [Limnospira sp.]